MPGSVLSRDHHLTRYAFEIAVLRGATAKVHHFRERGTAERGVRHECLVIVPVEVVEEALVGGGLRLTPARMSVRRVKAASPSQ